jgi:serine/threonine protein kinase
LIINACGTPDEETMLMISNENAKKYIESLPAKPKINLTEVIPCANKLAIDLLEKMLNMNPKRRITVEEALMHPYLESLHDPEDEPLFEN